MPGPISTRCAASSSGWPRACGPSTVARCLGALQCAAPEHFVGAGGSPRSDLFLLAVITQQLLAGDLPRGQRLPLLRAAGDLAKLPERLLRDTRQGLPPCVDAFMRQALQPRPARRQVALWPLCMNCARPTPGNWAPTAARCGSGSACHCCWHCWCWSRWPG